MDGIRIARLPVRASLKSPAWLKRWKFYTHRSYNQKGFTLTEASSMMAVRKGCATRKEAIAIGLLRMKLAGKDNVANVIENRIGK